MLKRKSYFNTGLTNWSESAVKVSRVSAGPCCCKAHGQSRSLENIWTCVKYIVKNATKGQVKEATKTPITTMTKSYSSPQKVWAPLLIISIIVHI